jgi:hypothetical protein
MSYTDEGMKQTPKEAGQHHWLSIRRVTPLYEIVLLGFIQSDTNASLFDGLDEESYIRGIIADKKLSKASDESC